jgi:hypothetical protein
LYEKSVVELYCSTTWEEFCTLVGPWVGLVVKGKRTALPTEWECVHLFLQVINKPHPKYFGFHI